MCDLIRDLISCSVWSCDMGKINESDKIILKTWKKENMEIKEILHKYQSKRSLRHRIHSELMPEEALKSFTVSDAYTQFAGQA